MRRNTIVNKTVRKETKRQGAKARNRNQRVHCNICRLIFNEVFLIKIKVSVTIRYMLF